MPFLSRPGEHIIYRYIIVDQHVYVIEVVISFSWFCLQVQQA